LFARILKFQLYYHAQTLKRESEIRTLKNPNSSQKINTTIIPEVIKTDEYIVPKYQGNKAITIRKLPESYFSPI